MKRLFISIIISFVTIIFLLSCNKNASEPLMVTEDDESTVQQLAEAEDNEYLFDLGIDDGSEDNMYNGYSSFGKVSGKITAPIDSVVRFGRRIHQPPRRVVTDIRRIAPDTIKVFVAREFAGRFVIFEKANDTTFVRHIKRLRHVVRRNVIYAKIPTTDVNSGRRRWGLSSVSLGQGSSLPNATIRIHEIAVVSSGGDSAVFTDPLNTMLDVPDDILTFAPGEIVTVRVKLVNLTDNPVDPLGNGSTEMVLLHYGANRYHHARKRFEFAGVDPVTGDNVYEGSWTIGQEPSRVYHAVIDAIDNGTIYDDNDTLYPYNSTTWSSPYRVADSD